MLRGRARFTGISLRPIHKPISWSVNSEEGEASQLRRIECHIDQGLFYPHYRMWHDPNGRPAMRVLNKKAAHHFATIKSDIGVGVGMAVRWLGMRKWPARQGLTSAVVLPSLHGDINGNQKLFFRHVQFHRQMTSSVTKDGGQFASNVFDLGNKDDLGIVQDTPDDSANAGHFWVPFFLVELGADELGVPEQAAAHSFGKGKGNDFSVFCVSALAGVMNGDMQRGVKQFVCNGWAILGELR